MRSSTMTGGSSDAFNRKSMDFYPTPADCTLALIRFLNMPTGSTVWEPACGDGAISRVLVREGYQVFSTDLRTDSGFGEGGIDFLACEDRKADAIITNPPFAIAAEFIERSLEIEVPILAMLVKSQFWHARSRSNLFRKAPPSHVLALTWRPAFAPERGKAPTMDFSWMVWTAGATETRYSLLSKP